jgi:hypothetical protein
MDEYYRELPQVQSNPVQNKSELQDVQIRALNRALNLLMALLRYRKIITQNETGWVTYIKNDVKLAVTIDDEGLLTNFLDLASRIECPKNFEGSIALIRNHKIVGPPKSANIGGVKFPEKEKEKVT